MIGDVEELGSGGVDCTNVDILFNVDIAEVIEDEKVVFGVPRCEDPSPCSSKKERRVNQVWSEEICER